MSAPGKILIVDDTPANLRLLGDLLTMKGYAVATAPNGEEGIRLYESGAPDLVLLDVHLPDMTGFEICRRIRTQGPRPQTPVLICTVRSEVAPVAEGLSSGATDYVLKPFQVSDLLERINTALSGRPHGA